MKLIENKNTAHDKMKAGSDLIIGSSDEFREFLDRLSQVAVTLRDSLPLNVEEMDIDATFPFRWTDGDGAGGPRVSDPLTIYIWLASSDESQSYTWSTTLSEMIDNVLKLHLPPNDAVDLATYREVFEPMAIGLEELAADLRAYRPDD